MTVIGIAGQAEAGETTLANRLATFGRCRVLPFAEPLKRMLTELGVPRENIYGSFKDAPCPELCGKSGREAMQTLGTDWGRKLISPQLWVNAWLRRAIEATSKGECVIVDDVRFPEEAAAVKSLGGIVVYVDRLGAKTYEHPSESSLSEYKFDRTIQNPENQGFESSEVLAIWSLAGNRDYSSTILPRR